MTAERFHEISSNGAWVDLSPRAKWLLKGADRVRYLNGQTTQDVRKAGRGEAVQSCVTNAKGRIEGEVFIHESADGALMLDAEPALRESLAARLGKYIVADDVEIEDVSDEWKLLHAFGTAASQVQRDFSQSDKDLHLVKCERFARPGLDIWFPAGKTTPSIPATQLSDSDAEIWRICHGVPRFPKELNEDAFPQEAGLEARAMDFSKGCYIGQEVLSRIKTTGKMPRRLVRFVASDPALRELQDIGASGLFHRSENGIKAAGTITSACLHPSLDRLTGLAFVRQGLEHVPTLLLAQGEPPVILTDVEISS